MLGWDWNNRRTSGIGVACYEIAKRLGKMVELTIIIPKKERTDENLRIIALNELPYQEHEYVQVTKTYLPEPVVEIITVPVELEPYPTYEEKLIWRQLPPKTEVLTIVRQRKYIPEKVFREATELYGNDIITKLNAYAELATKLSDDIKFDVVYAHDWITFYAAMQIQNRTRKPVVLHVHSLETDRSAPHNNRNQAFEIEKEAFDKADLIIAVSQHIKQSIEKYYQAETSKIFVVHNGVNHWQEFLNFRQDFDNFFSIEGYPTHYRISFIGRVVHSKGVIQFVEIASKLLEVFPSLRFAVAGEGEALWDMMYRTKELGIITKFEFVGFLNQEKLFELLKRTDVVLMPFISEPFGLSVAEALSANVPVVLSKQSGIAEVLPSAFAVDYWNTSAFVEFLTELLHNSSKRWEYLKNIKQDITKATWENTVKQIFEHIRYVVEEHDAPWFI
ncbi:MAG: glycosyltransferase family 4 protein [Cytophagales bacterium]|nr:glycosyltransferase family 4 protein [Cytophagales bacterium]MDW8383862.1 glycosyltransferase family 4 protein [Flammeovirgaceae bacterium]